MARLTWGVEQERDGSMNDVKEHIVDLVVGDWSHDGHEKTNVVAVKINVTPNELRSAYENGTKEVGFDLTRDVAADYKDNVLSNERMKVLVANGYDEFTVERVEYDNDSSDYTGDYRLRVDSFVDVWLFIAKLGDPSLTYEIVNNDSVNIGGYGLFY